MDPFALVLVLLVVFLRDLRHPLAGALAWSWILHASSVGFIVDQLLVIYFKSLEESVRHSFELLDSSAHSHDGVVSHILELLFEVEVRLLTPLPLFPHAVEVRLREEDKADLFIEEFRLGDLVFQHWNSNHFAKATEYILYLYNCTHSNIK